MKSAKKTPSLSIVRGNHYSSPEGEDNTLRAQRTSALHGMLTLVTVLLCLLTSVEVFAQLAKGQRPISPDKSLTRQISQTVTPKNQVWQIIRNASTETGRVSRRIDSNKASCVETPDGLIGWLPLDEGPADFSIEFFGGQSVSRNGHPLADKGKVHNALHFDGRDDFLEIKQEEATALNIGQGDFSFDAWVRLSPSDAIRGVRVILEKRQAQPLRGYSFFLYNGRPGVQLADLSGYSNYVTSFEVPRDGHWHLIAVSINRTSGRDSTIQFFVDGEGVGETFSPSNSRGDLSNTAPFRVGSTTLSVTPNSLFSGSLDEVEVFNRALSASEVSQLFLAGPAGKCKFAEIKLKLTCDNGKSTTVEVTGYFSAKAAVNWVESNCDNSVKVAW